MVCLSLQCSGPKTETQRFAEVTAECEFGSGKQPNWWLSILAPVITNKVERADPFLTFCLCTASSSAADVLNGRSGSHQNKVGIVSLLEKVMLAFLWRGFYEQRELCFWHMGIPSWVSFPRAESWGWLHPLCDGRAIQSALILNQEQKMSLVGVGGPVLEAATPFALYVVGVTCVWPGLGLLLAFLCRRQASLSKARDVSKGFISIDA